MNAIIRTSLFVLLLAIANTNNAQTPGGLNVTTYRGWFKADSEVYSNSTGTTPQTSNNAIVRHWKNLSANSPSLTSVTTSSSTSPILHTTTAARLMNFNPALNFISGDLRNESANILGSAATGFHFYIVARQNVARWNTTNSKHALFGNGSFGNNPGFDFQKGGSAPNGIRAWSDCSGDPNTSNNNSTIYSGNGTGVGSSTTGQNQPDAWSFALQNQQSQIFGFANSSIISNTCGDNSSSFLYTDGFRVAYPQRFTVAQNSMRGNGFYIGSSWTEAFPNADIAEMIVYSNELSSADRIKVETYLAIKYGITLGQGNNSNNNYKIGVNGNNYNYIATNDAVIWNAATGGIYNNNIAGIGRDDAQGLNQKQSRSVNYNRIGQVVIALGNSVAATNAANTANFADDYSYLIWGDNGDNTNTSTLSFPLDSSFANYTYGLKSDLRRLHRVWQVQNRQVSQPVRIQFPTDSLGTTTYPGESSCAKYVLLTSTDPTFATGVSVIELTTSGANYEAGYTFPTGVSYFSFGKIDAIANGLPLLTPTNKPTVNLVSDCPQGDFTYYYASDDATKANKLFAINWNGNTPPAGISGAINVNTGPWSNTVGANECRVMGRMLQISPAGGSFTTGGGIKLRFYFSETERLAATSGMTSYSWFKASLDIAGTLASNNGRTVFAEPMAPVFGKENGIDYAEFSSITSFSSFGLAASSAAATLPVTLKSVDVRGGVNCESFITWSSIAETNFDRFEVEYGINGNTFKTIYSVNGKGNGSKYDFVHRLTDQSVKRYYRLKMIDLDGTYKYSDVVSAGISCDALAPVMLPNPASTELTIRALGSGKKSIRIYTLTGKSIYSGKTADHMFILPIASWPSGAYSVVVEYESGVIITRKLIKQ